MPHRYLFQLTTAVVLLLAWSPITHAQVDWTHYSTEAVLDAFDEETWAEDGVWTPTVIRAEGDTLKMWYSGGNNGFASNQIGYAWSLDGVSWTRHPDNPVITPQGITPMVWQPRVLADGDTLRMWYAEGDFFIPYSVIRYATSTDGGVTWVRHPGPVIVPGADGTWNEDAIFPGDVLKEDGLFKMWFAGGIGPLAHSNTITAYSIGYATSPDGIAWTLHDDPATTEAPFHLSDPVLLHGSAGTFDQHDVSGAAVRRTDEGYAMWYHGNNPGPGNGAIGYATSPDGLEWTKHPANPVLTIEGAPLARELLHPTVLFYDGEYHMWLSLFGNDPPFFSHIGYATAPLTVAAEPGAAPSESAALRPPYPNPTAAWASIAYRLSEAAHVTLTVYDLLGREVARPVEAVRPAGEHTAVWDGLGANGRGLGAGVYVVRLRAGDVTESRKVLLLR